ncbi:MAG: geranylgeranyl reductase family protein [Caulobacteraceae bacterium]|nr:geranylgeranyl reductase family protein [Caulobacteraceae bacterium]
MTGSTDHLDVIVVGAGPAGCAAAYDLADAGLSVRLLDRKSFPRPKPCAGAVTVKALKRLRYSIAPVVRYVARDLEVTLRGERVRHFRSRHPVIAMTVREELDTFCLEATRARGADFRITRDIAEIIEDESGVTLVTSEGDSLRAAFIVGADGANSRVRKLIGDARVARAWALEGDVDARSAKALRVTRFDFAQVANGYGWVFPKGDHLNVGLYARSPEAAFGPADVIGYARQVLGTEDVGRIVGHPLGVGGETYAPARRVFLTGDAAGGAEPMLGEGIHNAIKSGQLAAEAIVGEVRGGVDAQTTYRRRLKAIRADLRACAMASDWFYRRQPRGFRGLSNRVARTSLMRGFAAGKTFHDIFWTFPLSPFYAIDPVETLAQFERESGQVASELAITRAG